ncbi:MAG: TauD/TfdA family dioxygenase, partial [Comamonadaceae bacterium]
MSAILEPLLANPSRTARLDIRPLAGRIGAQVHGLLLGGSLDAASFAALQQALLRYKVLFFRGQHHLDDAAHEAFGRLFGPLLAHPTVPTWQGAASL